MTRKDYWYAAGISLFSFVLCAIRYWYPAQRYFDEIYYPRSAAEYLTWRPQYEWTHPPLAKLLIALSMLLFGGMHSPLGNTSYGWRFLNVVIGAATVFLLYIFAKRLFKSTPFAAIAAGLLVFDGFHFTQSRIATPEITVAFFSLFTVYAFYRYWSAIAHAPPPQTPRVWRLVLLFAISTVAGIAIALGVVGALTHQTPAAVWLSASFFTLAIYTALRLWQRPRPQSMFWLWLTAVGCGLGAATKWNDLFDLILVCGMAAGIIMLPRPKWRLPLDLFLSAVLASTIALYTASYIPFFMTPHPASFESRHDLSGMMDLQFQMFVYHDITVTHDPLHPYSSKWWEWPLLIQPIAYWYKDFRTGQGTTHPSACCVAEIEAIPNPLSWWAGLLTVPFMGYLAWEKRKRAYLLLLIAYFVQWLPWIASPRMLFEYHFFPDDAVILLADTAAMQWIYDRAKASSVEREQFARYGIGIFLAGVVVMFAFFYPVLAGVHITWSQWAARMWMHHWIIGPG